MLLEGSDPTPPPAPPDPIPPAAPAPPEPEPLAAAPEEIVDLNEVDPKDEAKVRGLIAELSRKRAENRDLKTKADRVDQLQGYVDQNQPYIEVLRQNPGLLRQPQAPAAPAPPAAPAVESAEALEAARLFDFYKPDGTPDGARGAKFLEMSERRAEQIAKQHVAPIRAQTHQDKSDLNFQRALQTKAPNGATPDPTMLRALWQNSPVEHTADENYAALMVTMALGASVANGAPKPPALPAVAPNGRPPVITEPSGDQPGRGRVVMSDLERDIASHRGVTEQKWQDTTKDFRSGRPNNLE